MELKPGLHSDVQVTCERFALVPWSYWHLSLGIGLQSNIHYCFALLNTALLLLVPNLDLNLFSPADQYTAFANSVDPDEMTHYKMSHQDLHCFPFCF